MASEHLAAEHGRQEEDAESDCALGLDGPGVVRNEEEVVEREDRERRRREAPGAPAHGCCHEHGQDVEERRERFVRVAEREQGDGGGTGDRDQSVCGGAQCGSVHPPGIFGRDDSGPAGHPSPERSRLSCSRSPRAMRSSTSRTFAASSRGSNGLTR